MPISDTETKGWWKTIYKKYLAKNDYVVIDEDDEEQMMEDIISRANEIRDAKWLAKLRQCLAEMPVAGNGRRLLMMLINEMEKKH